VGDFHPRPFRCIGWTALALFVVYPHLFGPACLLCQRANSRSADYAFEMIYAPVHWARDRSPAVDRAASWYAFLWMRDIQ
jgi:hypothetical protein